MIHTSISKSALLPKYKDDHAAVVRCEQLGYPGYKEILPELFKWVQDMNWPIADEVLPLLLAAGDDTVPIIKTILLARPADTIWQYNVLAYIVPHLSSNNQEQLLPILQQLVQDPTHDQIQEEVDQAAQELIVHLSNDS